MSPKISALCEILAAVLAGEWSLAGVLPEVVPKIARLLKDTAAASVHALEVELLSLRVRVLDLDCLVPICWDTFEVLGCIF